MRSKKFRRVKPPYRFTGDIAPAAIDSAVRRIPLSRQADHGNGRVAVFAHRCAIALHNLWIKISMSA
jgi:hypothetical protein